MKLLLILAITVLAANSLFAKSLDSKLDPNQRFTDSQTDRPATQMTYTPPNANSNVEGACPLCQAAARLNSNTAFTPGSARPSNVDGQGTL